MSKQAFDFFEQIRAIRLYGGPTEPAALPARLACWGVADRLAWVEPEAEVVEQRVKLALAQRRAMQDAIQAGAACLLVLEEETLPLRGAEEFLQGIAAELAGVDWNVLYLGAATWGEAVEWLPGCRFLAQAGHCAGTHALAYSRAGMERLLEALPEDAPRMGDWIAERDSYDRFLADFPGRLLARPTLASLPYLLPYEDPRLREAYQSA